MGPVRARRSRRNRLCHNGESSDSFSLLSPVVTCRSSLFVDRDAMYFRDDCFILGNAVLFYFKVSLAVLELCSIRLKIIRFYSERLWRNFIASFDCIILCWFYGIRCCVLLVL